MQQPLPREVSPVLKRNGVELYPCVLGRFPPCLLSLGFRRLEIGPQPRAQLFPVLLLLPAPARGGGRPYRSVVVLWEVLRAL